MNNFDVIIPIKAFDWNTAKRTILLIKENIKPSNIKVVSARTLLADEDFNRSGIEFSDEDAVYKDLTFENVKAKIIELRMDPCQTGWYLQQFIKLAYSRLCKDEFYLVWDADTLPVRPIKFFNSKTNRPYLSIKREYHARYFKTLKTLLGLEKTIKASFIAEHMLIHTESCKEVLNVIDNNPALKGETFWEKILYASALTGEGYAFSEFETLGTFFITSHPDLYEIRQLETLRTGALYLGENPEHKYLSWAGKSFDTVSFEHSDAGTAYEMVSRYVRSCLNRCTLKKAIININCMAKALSKTHIGKFKQINERLRLRQEFDFFFNDKTIFEELGNSLSMDRCFYLDVTCLINYARLGSHVTGTERVVLSLAKELLKSSRNSHFIFRNDDDKRWYEISNIVVEDLENLEVFRKIRLDRHLYVVHSNDFWRELKSKPIRKRPAFLSHFLRNKFFYGAQKKHKSLILNRIKIETLELKSVGLGSNLLIFHWFNPVSSYEDFISNWHDRGGKVVFFFHDIIPLTNPEYAHPDWVPEFREYIHLIHKSADLVLTSAKFNVQQYKDYISTFDKKDLRYPVRSIGLPVEFNTDCIGDDLAHVQNEALWLKSYNYCLCVGSIGPRKNHFELLQAWRKFYNSDSYNNEILVIAGNIWDSARHIGKVLREDNCYGSIVLLEDVSDATLAYLYANCRFTVCLSLYEGWGLPVSESIAVGKPVIALNKTTLPEAGYGLAYLVDRNIDSVVDGLREMFANESIYKKYVDDICSYQKQLPTWTDFSRLVISGVDDI